MIDSICDLNWVIAFRLFAVDLEERGARDRAEHAADFLRADAAVPAAVPGVGTLQNRQLGKRRSQVEFEKRHVQLRPAYLRGRRQQWHNEVALDARGADFGLYSYHNCALFAPPASAVGGEINSKPASAER